MLSTSVTDGTTTQTKTSCYTLDGQVKTLTENGVTYAYTYDNTGRKTPQTETGGITKDYTYNIRVTPPKAFRFWGGSVIAISLGDHSELIFRFAAPYTQILPIKT